MVFFIIILNTLFSDDHPEYTVLTNNNAYPSNLFISIMGTVNPRMTIMNSDLNLLWDIKSMEKGLDFKINSQKISYFSKQYFYSAGIEGYHIIANEQMNEIDTLISINNNITNYHDMLLFENGGYMLLLQDTIFMDLSEIIDEPIYPQYCLSNIAVIEEYNNNDSLIFYWKASDYRDMLEYISLSEYFDCLINTNLCLDFCTPIMHNNSIDIDQDNNILLSNKLNSEIIKIDRTSKNIIWILGGYSDDFEFIGDPLGGFTTQHDVRSLENGNISLLDNGTKHNPMISRAVEYELDEINKTATLIWEYTHPDSLIAISMGSVQRLPNQNTLINWGNVFIPGEELGVSGSIITEVDYNKNIVMELVYSPGSNIYKARKEDWNFAINVIKGDTNLDSIVNVVDIIYLINYILTTPINNENHTIFNLHKIDLNTDGVMDVIDITTMVNTIVN